MKKVANLLFPADYFDKGSPDGAMRAEYKAAVAESRLDVSLFSLELFDERGVVSLARPFLDPGLPLIYRGWMMRPGEYGSFHRALVGIGLRPITSPGAYAEFHMFPLAYERHEALRSSSPGLLAFPGTGADAGAVNGRFERFMVKEKEPYPRTRLCCVRRTWPMLIPRSADSHFAIRRWRETGLFLFPGADDGACTTSQPGRRKRHGVPQRPPSRGAECT